MFHSCSLQFTRVLSCSIVRSCSDSCGVLDQIYLMICKCQQLSTTVNISNLLVRVSSPGNLILKHTVLFSEYQSLESTSRNPKSTSRNPEPTSRNPKSTGRNPNSTSRNLKSTNKNLESTNMNPGIH